jgi:hypothetical protein
MERMGRIVKLYKKPSRQRSAPNRVTWELIVLSIPCRIQHNWTCVGAEDVK